MKLKAVLETPRKPNENFHMLESITPLENTPNDEAWNIIKQLYKDSEPKNRILGIYLNAVITENKLTHLLSGKQLNDLTAGQNIVKPNKMNNRRASSIFESFIEEGYIEILRPLVEGKKAAVVRVNFDEVTDYVNAKIGAEISKQYEQSVIDFYDGVSKGPYPGPLRRSTTTTSTNTNTLREDSEPSASELTVLIEKKVITRPSLTRRSGTDTDINTSSMVDVIAVEPSTQVSGSPEEEITNSIIINTDENNNNDPRVLAEDSPQILPLKLGMSPKEALLIVGRYRPLLIKSSEWAYNLDILVNLETRLKQIDELTIFDIEDSEYLISKIRCLDIAV